MLVSQVSTHLKSKRLVQYTKNRFQIFFILLQFNVVYHTSMSQLAMYMLHPTSYYYLQDKRDVNKKIITGNIICTHNLVNKKKIKTRVNSLHSRKNKK